MPSNTNLGGVFMTDIDGGLSSGKLVSTENVCGIIFDTSIVGGISQALSGDAAIKFANGNVVEFNDPKEAQELLENEMCGLPYLHIKDFFTIAGSNQRLFVSFMDSDKDPDFEAVEKMQLAANGIIYQIGVWTSKPIAKKTDDGDYKVDDDGPLSKLQAIAERLGGQIGVTNYEGNSPVNILVNAQILNEAVVDPSRLPDLTTLNFPKVSVVLGQSSADSRRAVQFALVNQADAPVYVTVGNVGVALGCLALASVEQSIGNVKLFNLTKVMTECELGFGDLSLNEGKTAFADTASFTNIKSINYTKRNNWLHRKGYIFLRDYDGIENGVFFSSDQTLSTGDYRRISRGRTMHKSRRVVRLTLLNYMEENVEVDTSTGYIASADATLIVNAIYNALDTNMVQPMSPKTSQISGRQVIFDTEQNILADDQFLVSYAIVPKGIASAIYCTEGFVSTVSNS